MRIRQLYSEAFDRIACQSRTYFENSWQASTFGPEVNAFGAIHGALLDYLRDQEIRDDPQPRALAWSRARSS